MLLSLILLTFLLVSNALASHYHSKQAFRPTENEIDNNYHQDAADISASASTSISYGSPFTHHRDSYAPPSPFVKQHQHNSRTALHASPSRRLRKDPAGGDKHSSLDDQTDLTRGTNVGYILTAGGKEKIYDGDGDSKISPHASPFVSSPFAKKYAYDKSFKKYRFAYSNTFNGGSSPIVVSAIGGGSSSSLAPPAAPDEHEVKEHSVKDAAAAAGTPAPDTALARTFNALHTVTPNSGPSAALHKFYTDKTDMFGSKGTMWKQLGPNVEISSAAEHVPFTRQISQMNQISPPKERKKSKASSQQRKNAPKNLRTGFMTTQQHALYVANNLKGVKGGGGATFDHNNMLRQSDKFELTDAMISEAEKEEALKNAKALRLRFKQELPTGQGQAIAYQTTDQFDAPPQSPQYYSPPNIPFSFVAAHGAPVAQNAFGSQFGSLGKGFVRHIEIEMNGAGGQRKMIPALIIPLGPEASASNFVGSEVAAAPASIFINHPERHAKATFPYDIVAPRYVHQHPDAINAITASASAENYHLQPFAQLNYQYKTQLGDETSYNPYASSHYQNHNLYNTRFAFINGNGGSGAPLTTIPPTNGDSSNGSGTTASSAAHETRPNRFSAQPYGAHAHQSAKKPATHLAAEPSEQRPVTVPPSVASISTYIYDADNAASATAHAYLAPSESTYFATMTNMRDETRNNRKTGGKPYEKSDVRRD